eukprot:6184013-Pleurochrysis_carterae.AAC.1
MDVARRHEESAKACTGGGACGSGCGVTQQEWAPLCADLTSRSHTAYVLQAQSIPINLVHL